MSGHRNVGGTRGWKALRGDCPECLRDVATAPDYRRMSDPLVGKFRIIKRHHDPRTNAVCRGVGRSVPSDKTWEPV